jgi:hypothetical protein
MNSSRPHVPFVCRCSRYSNVVDHNVGEDRSKQTTMKMAVGCTARLGWKMTRDEELEQSRRALPKNLIRPLPYKIAKVSGSGDLLSRSPVHAGARDRVDYRGGASSERWQNPRSISGMCGSRARVYIGGAAEKPQATWATPTSHARVGYSSPRSGSDPNRLAVTRPSRTRFCYAAKR